MLGVGYHHAGVELSDRKLIEKAFTQADLPVLCESLYKTIIKLTLAIYSLLKVHEVRAAQRQWICVCGVVGDAVVTTRTLAVGVNLPAHLVVIKSTMQYVAGSCEEYSDADMLQMIGRAGRPQVITEKWRAVLIFLPHLAVVGRRGWWIDWWSVILSLWNQTWPFTHHSASFFPSSLTHQRLQWSWQSYKTKTSTWSLWMEWKSLRAGTVMH